MASVAEVFDDSFEQEVLQSTLPVLVDFWAEWCGPCRSLSIVLEEIVEEYRDQIKILKMNVDTNETTTLKYNIRSIPALLLFKNGSLSATNVGAMSKTQLVNFLQKYIEYTR